jgi:hypothetical protein
LRSGSLSDDKVISLLNRFFVPVYISYEAYDHGDAPRDERKEWQRIYHEANAKLHRSGTVHVYILAPDDGEVIESIDIGTATQPQKLLARLSAVVEKLKTVGGEPLVKPMPQSHPPQAARNGLVLHLAARSYQGTWNEFPVENWFVLSRAEAARLLPAGEMAVGESWELDRDTSARFLVKFLPNGFAYADHHKTEILEQKLRATVVSVEKGVVRARIDGRLKLKHHSLNFNVSPPAPTEEIAEMPLVGCIDFEPSKQRVRTIRLLADKATAARGQVVYAVALRSVGALEPKPEPREILLFDFEEQADLQAWSNLQLPDQQEPPVRIELCRDNATHGKQCLKLTFAGGRWPTISTTHVPGDWMPYWTFKADVTAGRHCVVGFTVLQEKSQRGGGWDPTVSRWTKTEFLKPGKNTVTGIIHDSNHYSINEKNGKVVRFEIFMYNPHDRETLYVDNIRLSSDREEPPKVITKFRVLGTDLEVSGVRELSQKLKERWTRPEDKTLEQVEGEFKSLFEEVRKKHPGAVLAVFRDGDKGYDPAHPDKVYAGWKDAYWSSHGPDGMTIERSTNRGRDSGHEIFMRHRSPLMQVDLSSIPTGSNILAARLIIIRDHDKPVKEHNAQQPNLWVVEPCNRPWEEYEVNAYEYAKDRFWQAIGGMYYGDDPDFLPLYLAHGPSQGKVNSWDFTSAVRFWTDGKHNNHGFMLHGDAGDWFPRAHAREAKDIKDRPAVWVIFEPGR